MEPLVYDPERLRLLDASLEALLATLQPSPESDAARRKVVAEMQAVVAEVMPQELHCSVETFGSFRAGLHLPGSDMDFAVTAWVHRTVRSPSADDSFGEESQQQQVVHEVHDWSPVEQQYLLADLADALEERGLVKGQVERVLHARVPIIKCIHKETGLACDFSISRPECAFKAEMQKLLNSIDRRYAALYRLVKLWAAAHGLNDASSSTLNSWSLGLMVAYYLQNEQPAVLPPIWQLLEQRIPSRRSPRILQAPGINSAVLRRAVNQAAVGAGAFTSRRRRGSSDGLNHKSLGELLAGFFELFGEQMLRWVEGLDSATRCSTWFGSWVDAAWPISKPYIFGIEDPFHSEDNTARSVGTHNHLSCVNSARYIAWAVATSAKLLRDALDGHTAAANQAAPSSDLLAAPAAAAEAEDTETVTPTAAAAAAAAGAEDAETVTPTTAAVSAALQAVPNSPGGVSLTDWLGSTASTAAAHGEGSTGSTAAAHGEGSTGSTAAAHGEGSTHTDAAGSTAAVGCASSTGCSDAVCQQLLTAVAWLFGPAVLQLQQLPAQLQLQLQQRIPAADLVDITAAITSLGDLSAALGNSSSIGCSDSNNSCLNDPIKLEQIHQALQLFRDVLSKLHAEGDLVVCMGDYQKLRKQQMRQRWEQQQQQLQQEMGGLRVGSAPADLQRMQRRQQQQQGRGRGSHRQQHMRQQGPADLPAAADLVSAALRPDGAMHRQNSSSSSNNWSGQSSSAVRRGAPRAAAAHRVHSAPDIPPSHLGPGFQQEPSRVLSEAPADGSRRERSGRLSSGSSSRRGHPPIPVPAGRSYSSSGSSRQHEEQGRWLDGQASADDEYRTGEVTYGSGKDGAEMLSSTAPAAAGLLHRGRGRGRARSNTEDHHHHQQQQQQDGQQRRAPRGRGGFAAVSLSQAGLSRRQ